jgi:hypothetical protein
MVPLLGLLAFSVDYGFLLYIKTELQRTADQAAIAAVMDLQPDSYGNQDLDKVRATVKTMVELNLGDGFRVENSDIEIGRFNPSTICENIQLLNTGTFDTVRVTVRRDGISNASVSLFFFTDNWSRYFWRCGRIDRNPPTCKISWPGGKSFSIRNRTDILEQACTRSNSDHLWRWKYRR